MITEPERIQLERIESAEGDFYAQLTFLVLWRYQMVARQGPWDATKLSNVIIEANNDMNERVGKPDA